MGLRVNGNGHSINMVCDAALMASEYSRTKLNIKVSERNLYGILSIVRGGIKTEQIKNRWTHFSLLKKSSLTKHFKYSQLWFFEI